VPTRRKGGGRRRGIEPPHKRKLSKMAGRKKNKGTPFRGGRETLLREKEQYLQEKEARTLILFLLEKVIPEKGSIKPGGRRRKGSSFELV